MWQFLVINMGQTKGSKFEIAAMVLGIASLASAVMFTVYIPFIVGGLAILFANLSRGKEKQYVGKARVAVITGMGGIILNTVIIALVLYAFFTIPAIREQVEAMVQQTYGMSFDEVVQSMLSGNSFF